MPLSSGFSGGDLLNVAIRLRRRPAVAYPILAWAIAVATAVRWLIDGHVVAGPFVTYYPVIIIAALLGGFWTGVVSIVCSAALGWSVFLATDSLLVAESLSTVSLLMFVVLAFIDVAIAGFVNKAIIRLTEQEQNVRSMVEALPNGVIVINGRGIVASVNAAAERIFGYARDELVGRPVSTLVPDRYRRTHDDGLAAYLRNPRPLGLGPGRRFTGRRKDGSEITLEVGLTPIERYGEAAAVATVIDISDRVRAEKHEKLLARELQHRTQNLFSVIQAIVARTLSAGQPLDVARHELTGRLNALAGVHPILGGATWEGVALVDILQRELGRMAPDLIAITGCDVVVSAGAAQQFALIVHELATNAFKYGALSARGGRITVAGLSTATAQASTFTLTWAEHGGPPVVAPSRKGFGSSILFEAARQFGMKVEADYRPEGLVYSLTVSIQDIAPQLPDLVPSEAPVAGHASLIPAMRQIAPLMEPDPPPAR